MVRVREGHTTDRRASVDISGLRYGPEIAAAASAQGLDPALLAAVAAQETGGPGSNSGRNIVGDGGHGHGLFQIDDRSWEFARSAAAMDPGRNAGMAATILSGDLRRYGGDVHAALSAYNTGSPSAAGTQTTWGDGQTLGYADSVLRHYAEITAGAPAELAAEQPVTSASVNALASYGAGLPAAVPATSTASSAAQATAGSTLEVQPLMATFSPPPPLTYNGSQQQAANTIGADADKALGDLTGAGDDVFGGDGETD
jgi:hypothetical protein